MPEIYDHAGNPVRHGRARVNGIRMHYVTAGHGEPLLLLHGTPKTHYYWYKLIPRLTEHFAVVAPDLRGFGDTDRPPAEEGHDSRTNADDVAELMTQLGHEQFHLHGEDRGAEFAYVLAATRPERVRTLCFAEMLLSGEGLEEWSFFTPENVASQFNLKGVWVWHIPFFWIPHIPEMLIAGREREFWEFWIKAETDNPMAIAEEAIDEWISKLRAPGGLRGVLETYRAGLKNGRINAELKQTRIGMPILTIGAPEFFASWSRSRCRRWPRRSTGRRSSRSAGTAWPWRPTSGWRTCCGSSCSAADPGSAARRSTGGVRDEPALAVRPACAGRAADCRSAGPRPVEDGYPPVAG